MQGILFHIVVQSRRSRWAIAFLLLTACIDPVKLDVPRGERFLVVEGLITDQPGPYSVTVSKSFPTDDPAWGLNPITNANVSLYADGELLEELVGTGKGVYQTTGVTGVVGRTYHIVIEIEGKRYISEPELLRPVGALTGIRAEFESRNTQSPFHENIGDRFNIYVDGDITGEPESFVRWRFSGTYLVRTNPELAYGFDMGIKIPLPYECSGFRATPTGIYYVSPCTCCTCWVTERDDRWFVAASKDFTSAGYKDIFVGQANITRLTFLEKYRVKIEQMSLSPQAHEFFRQLEAQAQGVESLFQPATGAIDGNISAMDSDERVLGLFYASSVKSISMNLLRKDVPYTIPPPDTIRTPCTSMRGSSNVKPDFW